LAVSGCNHARPSPKSNVGREDVAGLVPVIHLAAKERDSSFSVCAQTAGVINWCRATGTGQEFVRLRSRRARGTFKPIIARQL